ncbi:MAG: PAS domain-containing protein [Acidobacteria bacterium]|nr:PAS domain-containing protein [Acidobacteriota bacterium]MBW4044251.1 PAS domain-containing protein [Acidobacteriota bacterium]
MSLYQRLALGCLLVIALVTGLGLLVRTSFVQLRALDERQQRADTALGSLGAAQASVAREEVLADRLVAAPSRSGMHALALQSAISQQRLDEARAVLGSLRSAPSIDAVSRQHAELTLRMTGMPLEALQKELEQIDRTVAHALRDVANLRSTENAQIEASRESLRARLIAASGASIVTAIAICAVMLLFVILPLRGVAMAARRIGQGDLQHRVEWRSGDHLGIIAAEINRMAVRLRDLRETESGRRQMEQQLSDAVLQSIFEPIIVTDAKGRVLKLNQASTQLLGEAATDRMALANTPGGEKILEAVRGAVSMQRALAGEGEAALLPMRIGDAERSYRLRTTPMRDGDGKLLGAVTVLEDVTELRDIDRFKTRFLSVASQKLRDPLQRLHLAIYALARGHAGELRPLQMDILGGAQQETENLETLMSDLIEVAELETGRRDLKIERLRPLDILERAAQRVDDEAATRKIEIEIKAFADLSLVSADRRALQSVFDNLLGNALRYTPPGGQIRLEAIEAQDRIQFQVRDTGRGIEAERLPSIFGRFTGGPGDGTGLGLALVRRLVESLDGQVAVESRLGQGTTFSFTLPIASVTASRRPVEIG